jgi:hypothetical protein
VIPHLAHALIHPTDHLDVHPQVRWPVDKRAAAGRSPLEVPISRRAREALVSPQRRGRVCTVTMRYCRHALVTKRPDYHKCLWLYMIDGMTIDEGIVI